MRSFKQQRTVSGLPNVTQDDLERLSENVVGAYALPLSVVGMKIDGRGRLVPLATEEAGVVAGINKASKLADGFRVSNGHNDVRGVALICGVPDAETWPEDYENWNSPTAMRLEALRQELVRRGDPFVKHGGGVTRIKARRLGDDIELLLGCDTAEAMGAAGVTRLTERAAQLFVERFGGDVVTAIVANNGSGRHTTVEAEWTFSDRLPSRLANGIVALEDWAKRSYFRVMTHNKGILNGMTAAATAMGQDTRAIHAAAQTHAHQSDGSVVPISGFRIEGRRLMGWLNVIIPCGTVGGATQHPTAVACRKLAGVESANNLAGVILAAGLASNFASLLQLVSPEGFSATYEKLKRRRP